MIILNYFRKKNSMIKKKNIRNFFSKLKYFGIHFLKLPLYLSFLPFNFFILLISPWFLIRLGKLQSSRLGHFAANTELYFCERDACINVPKVPYIDLFCFDRIISNEQLKIMWNRVLNIIPFWVIDSLTKNFRILPGGSKFLIGKNSCSDRDVNNLFDDYPPHIKFTSEEDFLGQNMLESMGIPLGSKFVCLLVRDKAYLNDHLPGIDWSYHSYRDCDINNYVLAVKELINRGYYVIRMGSKVEKYFPLVDSKFIDYEKNGFRTDFMDIYLGSKCEFCISTSSGWDAIPYIFKKPIVYAPIVPIGFMFTFNNKFLAITKHLLDLKSNKKLSLQEIFDRGLAFTLHSNQFENSGIILIENSPEEIRDVVIEMDDKIKGIWQQTDQSKILQQRFWDIFQKGVTESNRQHFHGKYLANFSSSYLLQNQQWLN